MRMARFVFTVTILFCLLCAACKSSSEPKMLIEEKVFHFKEAVEGQIVEHIFHVRNQGSHDLEIQKVKPG